MNHLLDKYGWSEQLACLKQQSPHATLTEGRVTVVHKTCYEVITELGLLVCELTGNLQFGTPKEAFPCTGDWVLIHPIEGEKGLIHAVLPRQKTLYRKKSGTESQRQTLAAWLDVVFVVQGLDKPVNTRRLERFLLQINESGIRGVFVFTKTDLGVDQERVKAVLKHLSHIPIHFTSVHDAASVAALKATLKQGETVAFIGPSGVGKSTLINALCQEERIATSAVSLSTGKGRHTSTRREMILLEGSGLLIDTPGVREFGLTLDDTELVADTLNVADLESQCRFSDCTHLNEPGCAVIEAVNNGSLDAGVYASFLKLRREVQHYTATEHEKRQKDKAFAGMVKTIKRLKG